MSQTKLIGIREFCGRWYLYWKDTKRTIASFRTQFEAYSARRAIEKTTPSPSESTTSCATCSSGTVNEHGA